MEREERLKFTSIASAPVVNPNDALRACIWELETHLECLKLSVLAAGHLEERAVKQIRLNAPWDWEMDIDWQEQLKSVRTISSESNIPNMTAGYYW